MTRMPVPPLRYDPVYEREKNRQKEIADGLNIHADRDGRINGVLTVDGLITRNSPVVDLRAYDNDLAAAITAIGSDRATIMLPPDHTFTLTANATIPSTSALLSMGGIIDVDTFDLVINGSFDAGLFQVFDVTGGGSVTLGKGFCDKVRAVWFGTVGDGVTDDSDAINAAASATLESNAVGGPSILKLEATEYLISNPIKLYRRNSSGDFVHSTIELEGGIAGYIGNKRTEITLDYEDKPGIIIQAGRNTQIRKLVVNGTLTGFPTFPAYDTMLDETAWSLGTARNTRYSPYCGIAVDPFSVNVPADGGYPGLTAEYTNTVSSSVTKFEDVGSHGFVVGIALSTSGTTLQNDAVEIVRPNMSRNYVGLAAGQDQVRGLWVIDPITSGCWLFATGRKYGSGIASTLEIRGGVITYQKWLLDFATSRGTVLVHGLYTESVWSLGDCAGNFPVLFQGCHLKFIRPNEDGTRVIDHHGRFGGQGAVFVGCYLGHYQNTPGRLSFVGPVSFTDTTLDGEPLSDDPSLLVFRNVDLRYTQAAAISERYRGSLNTLAGAVGSPLLPGAEIHDESGTLTFFYRHLERDWSSFASSGSVTVTVAGDGTASFTSSNAVRFKVGDYVSALSSWSPEIPSGTTLGTGLSVGRVTAVVGNDVSLALVPRSFATGTHSLFVQQLPIIRRRVIVTATSGSAVLVASSASTGWNVNDRVQGARIPTGAYVTDITGSNITISQNATSSGTDVMEGAQLRMTGFGTAAPTTGVWKVGDFVRNENPSVDGNNMVVLGWTCTASGDPGTWSTMRASTVSPAT